MPREHKLFFSDKRKPHMPTLVLLLAVALNWMLILGAVTGCASHKTETVKTVTVEQPAGSAATDEGNDAAPARTTETTTTTESDDSSPGVIGSAFRLVWAVISLPFRVIGALF